MVYATVTVEELYPEKHRVLLETICKDENDNLLITGMALVKVP